MSSSSTQHLDGQLVSRWASAASQGFHVAQVEIDNLNVFPVPDGDTGTNLYLTAQAADEAVISCSKRGANDLFEAFAHGALLGARGNSGVIMSQILRGVADVACSPGAVGDGTTLTAALRRATDLAYQAVEVPKEGTILTVARAAADGADQASDPESLEAVCRSAAQAAIVALRLTPEQLPVLKDAGVVDAGGRGLVVLLDALVQAVTGEAIEREHFASPEGDAVGATGPDSLAAALGEHTQGRAADECAGPGFEVMYLLESDDEVVPGLRKKLAALGDSLVVVGGSRLWNVHVHVDDVGAAIEAAIEVGRPYRIKVMALEDVHHHATAQPSPAESLERQDAMPGRTLVAVAHGPGVAEVLAEAGVTVVRAFPGRRSSTSELLAGIATAGTREIILLPSDKDTRVVADAAAEQARKTGLRVAVIQTRSIVQTLAAVAVHDPLAHFDDDLATMGRSAAETRYGAVTVAVKDAVTSAGVCRIGDVLGLVDGDITDIGRSLSGTSARILDRMLSRGGELVTVVAGVDANRHLIDSVVAAAQTGHSHVDVEIIYGGQGLWPIIIGVE